MGFLRIAAIGKSQAATKRPLLQPRGHLPTAAEHAAAFIRQGHVNIGRDLFVLAQVGIHLLGKILAVAERGTCEHITLERIGPAYQRIERQQPAVGMARQYPIGLRAIVLINPRHQFGGDELDELFRAAVAGGHDSWWRLAMRDEVA